MVAIRPLISKFFGPCISPLLTVRRALITIGITVTYMFHSFFYFLASSRYLSWSTGTTKSTNRQDTFFLLIIIRSGRLADVRWSVCISKSEKCLCVSFFTTDTRFCIYQLFVWTNFNFLDNSQWIALPTQLCLVLCTFSANITT